MANEYAADRQIDVQDSAYLNYLPPHLRDRYLDGLQDAQLTHLRKQIALMDVRVKLLLEALDRQILTTEKIASDIQEEFPDVAPAMADKLAKYLQTYLPEGHIDQRTYLSLERLVDKHESAMADKRLIQSELALRQLFASIRSGRRDDEIWHEIEAVMDSRRKLVEAEERRLVQTQQMLKVESVIELNLLLINALKAAVTRYVLDRETQNYILTEAERIYSSTISRQLDLGADAIRVDG